MVSIADFPVDAMAWDAAMQALAASHPKGYIAPQLPPATLAFDVEDPKSHYDAPRMKLRVTGDVRSAPSSPRSGGARPKGLIN
jgi:hypothetical protein